MDHAQNAENLHSDPEGGFTQDELKEIDDEFTELPPNLCHVCRKEIEPGMKVRMLPCQHKFHALCLTAWLKRYPLCPMCKTNVRSHLKKKRVLLKTH